MTPLPDWAKGALWIGLGALVGFAVGALIIDSDTATDLAFPWLLVVALYTGGVLLLARRTAAQAEPKPVAPKPAAPAPAPAPRVAAPKPAPARPASPSQLQMTFEFPDIPADFPPVMGHQEPLRVGVRVTHLGKAATGAAVRMSGQIRDGAQFVVGEGVTGSDGTVYLTVRPHGTGELLLDAEARLDALTGVASASASIVRYDEEIERLFGEFRSYAVNVLGPESQSATARELAERLREGSPPEIARSLLELARVYELVAYGERDADRSLYVALLRALITLERGDLPDAGDARIARTPEA